MCIQGTAGSREQAISDYWFTYWRDWFNYNDEAVGAQYDDFADYDDYGAYAEDSEFDMYEEDADYSDFSIARLEARYAELKEMDEMEMGAKANAKAKQKALAAQAQDLPSRFRRGSDRQPRAIISMTNLSGTEPSEAEMTGNLPRQEILLVKILQKENP